MLWWPAMKAGSTAMTQRPRDSSQWKHPGSPRSKKTGQCKSTHETFDDPFFDTTGMIYLRCKEYYVEVLREFSKRFRRKRPTPFKSGQWHFHLDNALVHNSILFTDYLSRMGIKTVRQPPYSPDLAPSEFWLFPKLKEKLRSCRYETTEDMKGAVTGIIANTRTYTIHPNETGPLSVTSITPPHSPSN